MYKRLTLIILVMLISTASFAQLRSENNADPRYIIDPETGKLSMVIRVWGEVRRPGVIMVPSDADLISLLSYVGGPTDKAKLKNIQIIRYNIVEGEDRIVFADLQSFLETGNDKYIPTIYPNDTVIVKGTVWRILSTATPYINLAVTLINGYYLYTRTTN